MSVSSDLRQSFPPALDRSLAPANLTAAGAWPGLEAVAAVAGAPLSAAQLDQFARFQALLLEWNARFNLTAITDPAAIEARLFWDALRLAPTIDPLVTDTHAPKVVDIGSGAGFPALPLAIIRPEWDFTLIEATGKKVAFLDHVIAALGLPAVRTVHARAEDVGRDPHQRGTWQIATARAVASLPALIELTMPLLRVGGHAVLPKGSDIAAELAAGEAAAALVGAQIVSAAPVPETTTRIVVVTKTQPTPAAFPRRAGIPAREPLGAAQPLATAVPRRRGASASAPVAASAAGRRVVS